MPMAGSLGLGIALLVIGLIGLVFFRRIGWL